MKLEIREIKDRNTSEERVVLVANESCDLGYFFLFTTKRVEESKISIAVRNSYWLPSKAVKQGDLVVVYSRAGKSSFKVNDDKTTSHFFFRNNDGPMLISENDLVLLVEVNTWKTK